MYRSTVTFAYSLCPNLLLKLCLFSFDNATRRRIDATPDPWCSRHGAAFGTYTYSVFLGPPEFRSCTLGT